jgi:integrase
LDVANGHPLLNQKTPRLWFGAAWGELERQLEEFRGGDLEWEPEAASEPQRTSVAASTVQSAPSSGFTLKALLEAFVRSKNPKSEDDMRVHWRRLVEHLGDVDAATVSPKQLDDFLVQLRRFPKTRRPDIEAKTFPEIMAQHVGEGLPLLSPITVWKYFTTYQQVFGWAARIRELPFNPVEGAMPTKPRAEKKVMPYEPHQIADLFAKPMFVGCSKTHDRKGNLWGYRDKPGERLLKDGRYWMPILNLFHGNRMEEWGGAKVEDIKTVTVDDREIVYLDLLQRSLKTPEANRRLPLHPKMKELGFLDYVADQRKAKEVYLFPEFDHDVSEVEDPEASTAQFSKWWGLWSDANGFPDKSLNFHSWRHTFIRACKGKMDAEIRGLLTGHKGKINEGSNYGDGAPLEVLADTIAKVEFPTFPLKA